MPKSIEEGILIAHFECFHLKKSYGAVKALQDGTLSMEKGEVRAILGGNGSGKSTLAKIIGGVIKPDNGEMMFNGENSLYKTPSKASRKGIVITSQELSLFSNLTVEDNLLLTYNLKKRPFFNNRKNTRTVLENALDMVGLKDLLQEKVASLPDNQKYLVEFIKAILQKPKLLVIDEITSALYREEVEKVKDIIKDISQKGCSVLFISHRLAEIYSICSTVTVMRNGSVLATHKLNDISEEKLIEMMTGIISKKEVIEKSDVPANNVVPEKIIDLNNVRVPSFKSVESLEVFKGEIIGIAGLQGQGQSEFIRTIYGLNGDVDITIDGIDSKITSPQDSIKKGISFFSGDRVKDGIFPGRSIKENIEVVNRVVLNKRNFNVKYLLDRFKVKYNSQHQSIETLSGGNQQKVVAARYIGTKPRVIIMDDPTKGIDVAARADMYRIFYDLVQEGTTIIIVSSDEEELEQISRLIDSCRVLVMYNGEFVKSLTGKEITVANIISASIPREEKSIAVH